MKILWHSCNPTLNSGYGTQTALMVKALQDAGHEMAISCTAGLFDSVQNWKGIPVYPHSGFAQMYGADTVEEHAKHFGADLIWSWIDAFALPADICGKMNWAAWVPADSNPIMIRNIPPLAKCRWTVGPTRFVCRMLEQAGMKNIHYVPCAFDSSSYFPMNQDDARSRFGKIINRDLSGKFLVNAVSANVGLRKNFPAMFEAWSRFQPKHPNAILYVHTEVTGFVSQGTNLIELAKLYNINSDSILFPEQWHYRTGQIPAEYLNLLYNASDVHINTCYGEGFGLPIMDAQAAGCPTIVPNFASAGEIGFGIKVDKGSLYPTVPGGFQFLVDHGAVAEALETAYNNPTKNSSREAVAKLAQPWRLESVVDHYLLPTLNKMEVEIKENPNRV